jgi:putative transposase
LLSDVIAIVKSETLLTRHRNLVAKKWDCSSRRKTKTGRPCVAIQVENLVLQLARENPS